MQPFIFPAIKTHFRVRFDDRESNPARLPTGRVSITLSSHRHMTWTRSNCQSPAEARAQANGCVLVLRHPRSGACVHFGLGTALPFGRRDCRLWGVVAGHSAQDEAPMKATQLISRTVGLLQLQVVSLIRQSDILCISQTSFGLRRQIKRTILWKTF